MFKRIMKVLGIVLACFVVIFGAGVGIFALKGGFKEVKVDIMKLYFDADIENTDNTIYDTSETKTKQTIYTLSDVTSQIKFEPLDATNKDLSIKITGVTGILENQEELEKGIEAGKDFQLKIRKDSQGNNYGGVVNITAKSPNGLAQVTITLVVDVPIPDNSIYFSGDANNRVTTSGRAFTLAKNNKSSYIYLKSDLYNAFYLPVSKNNFATVTGNLKSTKISYEYYGLDNKPLSGSDFRHEYEFGELEIVEGYDKTTHTTAYYYKIPVTPKESGTIKFTAKTHRSYTIQKEFEENGFDNLESVLANSSLGGNFATQAAAMRKNFTNFINKYIDYFNDTEESSNFFRGCINSEGKIELTVSQAISALDYVFVTCTANVDVSAVNLNQIKSTSSAKTYNVFDTVDFSKKDGINIDDRTAKTVYDEFELGITLNGEDGEEIEGTPDEENTLFDTLEMGAYIYFANSETEDGEGEEGVETFATDATSDYSEVIPVYGFDGNLPITPYITETLSLNEKELYQDGDGNYITIGYLYKIKSAMTSNKYMEINSSIVDGEVCWSVGFNVPLTEVVGEENIDKALYFRFYVYGANIKNNSRIDRETFTRIYIDFTEYEYASSTNSQLTLVQSVNSQGISTALKTNMALNTNLNVDDYAQNFQTLTIDTSTNAILNYNSDYSDGIKNVREVQYKNVMYFAEAKSNALGDQGAKQIITMGRYNFSSMSGTPYLFGEDNLEGERIPLLQGKKDIYIQALNASQNIEGSSLKSPVKIFAVVYLSDKDGNPINLNGEKIVIDEDSQEEATMLYVIAMSDISTNNMTNIVIHNFVDNVNFYTKMATTMTICKDSEDLPLGITYGVDEWVKRNSVTSFTYNDGATDYELNEDDLNEYNDFLRLKLLRNKEFNLYLTNFDMSVDGEILDATTEKKFAVIDINGNLYEERGFVINSKDNKQIAFNNLCSNFTSNYGLSLTDSSISIDSSKTQFKADDSGNYEYISFTLKASSDAPTLENYSLFLASKNKNAPFSDDVAGDRVALTVNKIEIYDVTLNEVEQINSLYARYIEKNYQNKADNGKIEFYSVSTDGQTEHPYIPQSIGDITYSVSTNLVQYGLNGFEVNTSIVDPSQAVWQVGEEEESTQDVGADIDSYIKYYSQSGLNVSKAYVEVGDYARLKSELVVELVDYQDQDNLDDPSALKPSLIIGNSIYQNFETGSDGRKYIEMSGEKYYLDRYPFKGSLDRKDLKIVYPVNSYFPLITIDGKLNVLILGEQLEVYANNRGYQVFKKESITGNVNEISVEKIKNFDVDGATSRYSAANYIGKTGNTFELKSGEDHTTRYYEDVNGQYYYNSSAGKFELITDKDFSDLRYTPENYDGIITYILIRFSFIPDIVDRDKYELEINKVLTFELIQKDLNFTFYVDKKNETKIENSVANRLSITARTSEIIELNPNGEVYPAIYADDTRVFSHITIENAIDGVTIVQNASNQLTIRVDSNFGQESDRSFKISYSFKGETKYHEYFIKILPNYTINFNSSAIASTTADLYILNIDAYGVNKLSSSFGSSLMSTDTDNKQNIYFLEQILGLSNGAGIGLFNGSTGYVGYTLTLKTNHTKTAQYNSNQNLLIVGESLVMSGNEYLEFTINITISDGNVETLDKTLRININPTYMVTISNSLTETTSASKVFNGTNLFDGKYIEAKGYNSEDGTYSLSGRNSLGEAIDYSEVFSIKANGSACDGTIDIYNAGTPVNTDTLVELNISFGYNVNVTRYIIIKGIELYYSRTGEVDNESYSNVSKYLALNGNITIDLFRGTTIELDKYFAFYTAGGNELLSVMLKANGSDDYTFNTLNAEDKTYDIYFALSENGRFNHITRVGYTLTIRVIDAYVSESGAFDGTTYNSDIHTEDIRKTTNIQINLPANTVVDLNKYILMFVNADKTNLPVYIYNGSNYVNNITITTDATYQIYYMEVVGEDNIKYAPISYTITFKVVE